MDTYFVQISSFRIKVPDDTDWKIVSKKIKTKLKSGDIGYTYDLEDD
jgi:hypothetical protein